MDPTLTSPLADDSEIAPDPDWVIVPDPDCTVPLPLAVRLIAPALPLPLIEPALVIAPVTEVSVMAPEPPLP